MIKEFTVDALRVKFLENRAAMDATLYLEPDSASKIM